MKFDAIKNILGSVAPTIGAALGGPVGGAAGSVIAKVLGVANEPRALEQAIKQATPEQLAELKKAELDFQVQMKALDVDVFALETADVQNAREVYSTGNDWTPKFIAVACVLFFGGYIALVTVLPPDSNSDTIVSLVLGYLGGIVSSIISFYYGASHDHKGK
tara:strand:+ start:587 stop:1072 length:486 start_codon:yes stop_codon:yes gene_type:complete